MRIGIFDPYLDTLGGGERYILTAASYLSKKHRVEVFWNDSSILSNARKKLNIDLSSVKITDSIFSDNTSFYKKIKKTAQFDWIIYLSDGSVPFLFAKKNTIVFQFPVNWVKGRTLLNTVKMKKINKIVCYTDYVKQFLDETFSVKSVVIYPPVVKNPITQSIPKENIILTVGRFTQGMNMKKQEVLINAYKQMEAKGLNDWTLVMIGSYLPTDQDFVNQLKKSARGHAIKIITNASFNELNSYYKKSKIYWHAAGFGEDLNKHPERAEHFGITTVEAMGSGVVPVVINEGGQREIVSDNIDGFLWDTVGELQSKTELLINDKALLKKLSTKAMVRANDFSVEKFGEKIEKLAI